MPSTTMVHVRLDERLKAQAADTLAGMGLSISDAVRMLLTKLVAEQRFPFELRAPNAETRKAMVEAEAMMMVRKTRYQNAGDLIDALEEGGK